MTDLSKTSITSPLGKTCPKLVSLRFLAAYIRSFSPNI